MGAGACAQACAQAAPVKEHGPIFGDDAASDATTDTGGSDDGGPEAGDDATSDDGGGDATIDSPAESGSGEAGSDASADSSAGGDGGSDAGAHDAASGGDASDAASDAGANDAASGGDASDAGSAADASDSGTSDASDGGSAPPDAGDAGGFVAPTCDGVIGAGEYGDATHQDASGTGQTWYMTWDDKNLYVAIAGATVSEGNVLYVAPNPGDGGTGSTSGQPYDNTDITALPFAADLVVYAKDGYDDAQVVSNGTWGSPVASAIQVCTDKSSTREEVIPWSLLGGRPAAFGWLGYVAANPNNNPQGYIYAQMPTDDPGGAPANNLTYTKYFAVPDATPGVDAPFADEQ